MTAETTHAYPLIKCAYMFYLNTLFAFKENSKCMEKCRTFKAISRWFMDNKAEMFCYEI